MTEINIGSDNPFAKFDNRVGGTITIAKREFLSWLQFGKGSIKGWPINS